MAFAINSVSACMMADEALMHSTATPAIGRRK
jgi:hypothetical protein